MAVRKKSNKDVELENTQNAAEETIDIDLTATRKKRFRINGDNDRILYLNTSDFGIVNRFQDTEEKIPQILAKHFKDADEIDDVELGKVIAETDKEMRDLLDYVFDAPVADTCSDGGSMFDLFNGEFRFEHILKALLALYNENLEKETKKMKANISRYTKDFIRKG